MLNKKSAFVKKQKRPTAKLFPLFQRGRHGATSDSQVFNKKIFLLLLFGFAFRLLVGLVLYGNPSDDILTYVIGLKYYCTGEWPYFGPVVGGSETSFVTRIPGALEGFFIGGVLKLFPFAEAPFIALNILNTGALFLFAWYCHRRFPKFPLFWILAYFLFLPWELYLSTNINNASFVLFGSVLFFIGFFESVRELGLGIIPLKWACAMMGFSLFWVMQFHMSWFFLGPFLLLAFGLQAFRSPRKFPEALGFFILGAIPTAALLVPTLIQYGLGRTASAKGFGEMFDLRNFHLWRVILQRYFTIANYEVPIFWGMFEGGLRELSGKFPGFYLYFALGFILKYVGKFQVFALVLSWFLKDHPRAGWREFKFLALFFYLFIWVSFWFTVKWPLTHIYQISYPVIMTYSLYGWYRFAGDKRWARVAQVIIVTGFLFQTAFPIIRRDYYVYQKRPELQAAIDQKNYQLFSGDVIPPSQE